MFTFLIVGFLTSLFAAGVAKGWGGLDKTPEGLRMVLRMALATAGFASLHLIDILNHESSFFGAIFIFIGVNCGVISTYVVVEKALSGKRPIFMDNVSLVGSALFLHVGVKACQWLYIGEVIVYLLIVLL